MSGLYNLLQNVRSASILTDVKDAENSAQAIDSVIKSNAHKQLYSDPAIRKQSLKDIKALYNELVAGNIDLGSDTNRYKVKLKKIIKETERTQGKGLDKPSPANGGGGIGGTIKENITAQIPSKDQIIGAAAVSSPIMGFGIRFMQDLIGGQKERKAFLKQQQRAAMDNLKRESGLDEPTGTPTGAGMGLGATDLEVLEELKKEASLQTDLLGDIFSIWEGSESERLAKHRDDSLVRQNELQKNREEERSKPDPITGPDALAPNEAGHKLFAGIFDSMQGFLAPIAALFAPILSLATKIPVLVAVGSLISVGSKVYEDLQHAAEILGKSEENLTLIDYGAVAIGSIAEWAGGIIDSIMSFFGVNTNFEDKFGGIVRNFVLTTADTFTAWVDEIAASIQQAFEDVKNFFLDKLDYLNPFSDKNPLKDTGEAVGGMVHDATSSIGKWWRGESDPLPPQPESVSRRDIDPIPESYNPRTQSMKQYGVESGANVSPTIVAPSNANVDNSTQNIINQIPRQRERESTIDWLNRTNFAGLPQ